MLGFLSFGMSRPVAAGLLDPGVMVAGKSQNAWAEQWWRWAANIPAASNPVLDTTGEFSYLGDQGDVFFLAGVFFGGDPIHRTVTVRRNQFLFFPLLNAITWDEYSAYDDFERDLIETVGEVSDLFASLDGVSYGSRDHLLGWLQQSPENFELEILEGGFFWEAGETPGIREAQQRGYYLTIAPLSVGTYVLNFGGRSQPSGAYADWDPNIQNITYTIRVVPEPSSWLGGATGAVSLILLGIRKRGRIANFGRIVD